MKAKSLFTGMFACTAVMLFCMGTTACSHDSGGGGGGGHSSNPPGAPGTSYESGGAQKTPSQGTLAKQGDVTVKMSEGLQNSAYVVFSQISGAEYDVLCDGIKLDEQLIRYYGTYTYNVPKETNGNTTYTTNSFQNVVRVDALGLRKGQHTIKIAKKGSANYTEVKLDVLDHDRSGFAFTGAKTPGAYNKDGTLKSGAIVIYLTQENKKTVTATIGGTSCTGIQEITQQIKKSTVPVDIRIVGTVKAENNDLSSSDMDSAYALGVKESSEVTIEGVGHDATLYGAGVAAFSCSYIEIANLGLMKWGGGKDGDGIALKGGKGKGQGYIWVHNNDVFYGDAGKDGDQVKGDGSMDLKDDTKYVTIAYNHFWDSGKMSLCGMTSETGPNYITYHHNWFDHSDSRHPRIRTMTVHVYNNYYDGNAKYGVGVTTGASAFVEGNYFRNAHSPMLSSKQGTDALGSGTFSGEKGGVIKSFNNEFAEKNTNGVKFQLITNKYDYTNNKALGEYREWYDNVGDPNGDGTYTIYDTTADKFETNSLLAIEDASDKGGYYQVSSGKTGFYIDVPANVQKVIVKAKCGSSSKTGTANMLSVNDKAVSMDMAADYKDYEFAVSVTEDSTIEIANVHGSYSMNVKEIKVIAASAWRTKLTEGADPTNIDAYEVDNRSDKVPDNVKTRSGGTTYSNFDTTMGNSGLGLSANPTGPKAAKTDVLNFAGRHYPDFTHTFNNTVDDASYAKNDALNNALVNYKTGFSKVQGTTAGGDSSSGGDSGNTGGGTTTVPTESITLNKTALTLKVGGSETLTATRTPANSTDSVAWSTSDKTVATVSNGKVTAVKAGTAKITATAGGKSAECTVTVEEANGVRVWLSSGTLSGNCLNAKLSKVETKMSAHSDISISDLSTNDFVSSVKLHVCYLDGNGANLYTKDASGASNKDIDDDYIEFEIKKQCTVSFTSDSNPASLKTSAGGEIETQSAAGLLSKSLAAGTYRIYGTKSGSACKVKYIDFE